MNTKSTIPALVVDGASRSYRGRTAVLPLELTLQRAETVALLGPNGAGKSTTIGMMLGLLAPDAGRIHVGGLAPREAVARGEIAGMLQDAGFMPGVRVGELVRLAEHSYPAAIPTADALDLAGLADVASRRVDRLSGGQSQRLRFALAIVANPSVLVLDEPTRALDVPGRLAFWESMRRLARTGTTILFATHYLDEVDRNAQRVIVMSKGRVVADGPPAEIRDRAGVSTIRFSLGDGSCEDDGGVERNDAVIGALPGVRSVVRDGTRVTLTSSDPDATIRALACGPLSWRNLDALPPSLDDSFISLTSSAGSIVGDTDAPVSGPGKESR